MLPSTTRLPSICTYHNADALELRVRPFGQITRFLVAQDLTPPLAATVTNRSAHSVSPGRPGALFFDANEAHPPDHRSAHRGGATHARLDELWVALTHKWMRMHAGSHDRGWIRSARRRKVAAPWSAPDQRSIPRPCRDDEGVADGFTSLTGGERSAAPHRRPT